MALISSGSGRVTSAGEDKRHGDEEQQTSSVSAGEDGADFN